MSLQQHELNEQDLIPKQISPKKLAGTFSTYDTHFSNTTQNVSTYNRNYISQVNSTCGPREAAVMSYLNKTAMNNILPPDPATLTKPIHSVDLREWGIAGHAIDQGTCGACYQFVARYMLTSLFVHDMPYYNKTYNTSTVGLNTGNTLLSVQLLLNDSYGSSTNQFCAGGNSFITLTDVANMHVPSLDFDSAVPYAFMFFGANSTDPLIVYPQT
jgi:hypothetical protein